MVTDCLLLLLQPFYGPLSGITQVSRYQKDKPFWILLKQRWWCDSDINWTICKSSALCSGQITILALHHSPFLWAGCSSCCPTNSIKALKASGNWLSVLVKIEIPSYNSSLQFVCLRTAWNNWVCCEPINLHAYLSGVRCTWFWYGPADAIVIPSYFASLKFIIVYTFSDSGLSRLFWKNGLLLRTA